MSALEREVTRIARSEAETVVQQIVEPLRLEIRKLRTEILDAMAEQRKELLAAIKGERREAAEGGERPGYDREEIERLMKERSAPGT